MVWGIPWPALGIRDWGVAMAVTLGCTEFLLTGPTASKAASKRAPWFMGQPVNIQKAIENGNL